MATGAEAEVAAHLWRDCDLVVFDVDGTLYDQAPLRWRMAARLLAAAAASLDPGLLRVVRALRREREALADAQVENFEPALYDRVGAACGVTPAMARMICAEWLERRPLPHLAACAAPGVTALFDALRATGRRIAVLSDYPASAKLAALSLQADPVVSAADPEVGIQKPHPAGLRRVLSLSGVDAGRALVIGDRADRDGAAAAALGAGFLLRGPGGFQRYDDPVFAPVLAAASTRLAA